MANPFRRGFKAEAERMAIELREELGIGLWIRLDPIALARHLCIPVLTLHDLHEVVPREVRHFAGQARTEFSAVTIYVGAYKRVIVTNPFHAATRRGSSVCHELGHIILEHEAEGPLLFSGRRAWNGTQESEADWLAGCLLITQAATRAAARDGRSDADVANTFGVSEALAAWRMNATGARILASRMGRLARRG